MEEKLPPSLLFVQDEITLIRHKQFNISSLLTYKNIINDINYSIVDNSDVVSLNGDSLVAEKVGHCEVKASYENVSDSITINVISQKPTIQYTTNDYEFDVTSGYFNILDYVSFSSSNVSMSLTSDRNDYTFEDGRITFLSYGNYPFSLTISEEGESSDPYNFVVYAYDSLMMNGSGTVEDPYLVTSAEDLKRLSDAVMNYGDFKDKYFLQTNDIDLSGYDNWQPIGTFGIPFEGIYNGDNKEVTGLKIETYESWQGLFGFVSGTVKNVIVKGNINILGTDKFVYYHSFAAGVCGGIYNAAMISNCVNYVNVHGHAYVGGIVGGVARSDEMIVYRDQSHVINCKNYGTITGNDEYALNENAMYFGGIVGESLGILTGNINYGTVTVTGTKTRYVGGVCGLGYTIYKYGMYDDEDLEIYASNNNINYGEVTGHHSVGGVFGANVLPIHNCDNYGKVMGNVCVGGVSGLNGTSAVYSGETSVSLIEGCTNYGEVYATNRYSAGVVSYSYFDVKNCVNKGYIHGGDSVHSVSGVVGYNEHGSIDNCINEKEANIIGATRVGGVVGQLVEGLLTNSYNYSTVTGTSQYIGGISAVLGSDSTSAKIRHCANYGSVNCTSPTSIYSSNGNSTGGAVGFAYSYGDTEISYCYNFGDVTSISCVGGIVGSFYSGTINHAYNFGDVEANMMCAGIVGYSQNNTTKTITNCISGGTITGQTNNNSGGILGRGNFTTISNCVSFASVSPSNSHSMIYGTLNNGSTSSNRSYTDTNAINELLKAILSINVSSKEEAQTVLNNINSLEGSLNTRDNEILLLEGDEDKTFSTLLTEAKQKLNEIINGGDHD